MSVPSAILACLLATSAWAEPPNWEFSHDDRIDLAAMGRVWYIECWARARMGDGEGLVDAIQAGCAEGKKHGYYWRERYNANGGFGVEKYCEYPATLIRIVQRFVLGVNYRPDGSVELAPCVPKSRWETGFGQTRHWRDQELSYQFQQRSLKGTYAGKEPLTLYLRRTNLPVTSLQFSSPNGPLETIDEDGATGIKLDPTATNGETTFEINWP